MPMTYSIAYGLIAGIVTYMVLNVLAWLLEKASGGRIVPYAKELSDPWTWRVPGGLLPQWVVRLGQGKSDFWNPHQEMQEMQADPEHGLEPGDKLGLGEGEPRSATALEQRTSDEQAVDYERRM